MLLYEEFTPDSAPRRIRPTALSKQHGRTRNTKSPTDWGDFDSSTLWVLLSAHHCNVCPPFSCRWETKMNIYQTSSPLLCIDRRQRADRGRRRPRCTFTSPRQESAAFIFSSSFTGKSCWRGGREYGGQEDNKCLGNGTCSARSDHRSR